MCKTLGFACRVRHGIKHSMNGKHHCHSYNCVKHHVLTIKSIILLLVNSTLTASLVLPKLLSNAVEKEAQFGSQEEHIPPQLQAWEASSSSSSQQHLGACLGPRANSPTPSKVLRDLGNLQGYYWGVGNTHSTLFQTQKTTWKISIRRCQR